MKKPVKVMVIEDSPKYREVIGLSFGRSEEIEICEQFGTAEGALLFIRKAPREDQPAVILLDLNLPGMSGIDLIPKLKQHAPDAEILILTQSDNEADIFRAITGGATGYLLKSATIQDIRDGIIALAAGEASLDTKVARYILAAMKSNHDSSSCRTGLSAKEREVLHLLAEGYLQKEIADRLGISVTTVAYHIKHIYEKLNVQNAAAAVAKAYESGFFKRGA